jgi:hypothetical protein
VSTPIKTIDERIRLRAREQLAQQLDKAIEPISHLACVGNRTPLIQLFRLGKDGSPHQSDVHDALGIIREAIFERLVASREEKEIENFLKEVGRLGEQLDELRNSVEGDRS